MACLPENCAESPALARLGGAMPARHRSEKNRPVSASALKLLGIRLHGQAGLIKKTKKC
jgi:hypothetical protein